MSYFVAKMHQINFGAYSAPPDLLAGFKGPTSKGREERKDGSEGQGRRKGGPGREGIGKGRGA